MTIRAALSFFHPSLFALLLAASACGVGPQRQQREQSIPAGAQESVDRVSAQIEEGRDEEIYEEAAEEWRRTSTPEQSAAIFQTLRAKLGKVRERARQTAYDEQRTGTGHRLIIRYATRFERGEGMETFTLLERDGRWLLAGYMVNSDALKQ